MTETLSHGYSSESTQRRVSNEYQHDRVSMVFKNLCDLVYWTKVALALEGLRFFTIQFDIDISLFVLTIFFLILTPYAAGS